MLLESLRSDDPIIRSNAIDEIDDLEWTEALPHLYPLVHDEDANVREAACTAIATLEAHKPRDSNAHSLG